MDLLPFFIFYSHWLSHFVRLYFVGLHKLELGFLNERRIHRPYLILKACYYRWQLFDFYHVHNSNFEKKGKPIAELPPKYTKNI